MFIIKDLIYKDILNIKQLILPRHQVTCILGESGAGKSTLLMLLNKIISFDSGEILYDNTSILDINSIELRRNVVMLPQSPAIYPGTIRDNLLIGLQFSQKPISSDTVLKETMAYIYLDKDLDQDAEKLSGGEKQRLALGRILLLNPDVFLLDEPSSALDESTAHLIIEKLVNHTKTNHKTLIMVTHSQTIATEFADYIIKIAKGKIQE